MLGRTALATFYELNIEMAYKFGTSLTEWDDMIPFELWLYIPMLRARSKS